MQCPTPELVEALRHGAAALARAGVDPTRDLLAPFSSVVISLERSCPPPALLACRPAIRFAGRLRGDPPPGLERSLAAGLVAGLRAAGFRRMDVHGSPGGDLAGRITSDGEVLARWRLVDDVLVVVTGGLELEPEDTAMGVAAGPAGATRPVVLEVNPTVLGSLVGDGAP